MTETGFATDLEHAFREPAPGVDTAALERAILGRVERADRQRWLVLSVAAALGLAIALVTAFGSGFVAVLREAWLALRTMELDASGATSTWLLALVGLVVLATSIVRAARDA